jgi:hypothetical protein
VLQPGPNFSPFPFDRLPRRTRREAAIESTLARWVAPRRLGSKVAALAGAPVRAHLIGVVATAGDPHAAVAEVRCGGVSITVAASARPVRALAQRLLRGPVELEAPRPLTVVEQAIWALVVGAALVDLDVAGEVWPVDRGAPAHAVPGSVTVAFAVELPPWLGTAMTVTARFPPEILVRARPPRGLPGWRLALPVVVGRCALPRASLAGLAVRDVITIEPGLELVIGAGAIGLTAAPGAVEARVATEYGARHMALVDDATLEVTVQLGMTRLSLRQLGELAVGQIVPLGRPLAGPYEVRAAGRVLGQGELVDIDGELGVRIVSIADQSEDQE